MRQAVSRIHIRIRVIAWTRQQSLVPYIGDKVCSSPTQSWGPFSFESAINFDTPSGMNGRRPSKSWGSMCHMYENKIIHKWFTNDGQKSCVINIWMRVCVWLCVCVCVCVCGCVCVCVCLGRKNIWKNKYSKDEFIHNWILNVSFLFIKTSSGKNKTFNVGIISNYKYIHPLNTLLLFLHPPTVELISIFLYIGIYLSKLGEHSQGWPEGSLF